VFAAMIRVGLRRVIRSSQKIVLSSAVIAAFGAYVLNDRLGGAAPERRVAVLPATTPIPVMTAQPTPTMVYAAADAVTSTATPLPTQQPVAATATPLADDVAHYKDGVYTGDRRSAMWGMVQVAIIIRGGRLVWVEMLDFPQDRETSIRINELAVPKLQSEAIKAQSAEVDIISGATLTSRAFYWSLYAALKKAAH
jgi:uncharacterized protein with FMN-binding domain